MSRNYWWVSQNKTFVHEVGGGYLWAPQTNKHRQRVAAYEFMTRIEPGDIVFSFAGTYIRAIGLATGRAYDSMKPEVFGKRGAVWSEVGWRVPVEFTRLETAIRPANHMQILEPLLPDKYSPIRADGAGNQQYLFPVPAEMGNALVELCGHPQLPTLDELSPGLDSMELRYDDEEIVAEPTINDTDKAQLVLARRGQGVFRQRVRAFEPVCRVTGVSAEELLVRRQQWAVSLAPYRQALRRRIHFVHQSRRNVGFTST